MTASVTDIAAALNAGEVIPYLGPNALTLCPGVTVPATPEALCEFMTAKVTVPHKIRKRLTQAAQFIENFKHRKTIAVLMNEAYAATPEPSALHLALARSAAPVVVDSWYDDALIEAFKRERGAAADASWGQVQGLSQSEHFGTWTGAYDATGAIAESISPAWKTLVYKPIGGHAPAGNYLVSDSDYVEVLTEIDIQTPIPTEVQTIRTGRSFLFIGCRFNDQLPRAFARQIMKRSSDRHWAVLPEAPTRMEQRFMEEQNITRIDMPLDAFAAELAGLIGETAAA
ncbi:SIR2 family NAD-dependent protein deacylase [Derxia gummosa]|uniref:SIR2 family NAD-dependent protein deacylase n=1 Tax=Derxia gummosa DSM 723 TaxID=1121388 RepID=A0A8B6X1M9_9BURK|nr:SIR2 family protein [Derxia gummosa]